MALAYPIITLLRERRDRAGDLLLGAMAASFVANMAFVIVSRTALVTMPIMPAVFGVLHLRWRVKLLIVRRPDRDRGARLGGLAAARMDGRRPFRGTTGSTSRANPTSIGERLEYWRNALQFFADAPLVGHGTGSTKGLFEQAAQRPGWIAGVRGVPQSA